MATTPKVPLGITVPIRKTTAGYFDQSFDSLTQIRSNIINLLNTRPGERRMQPTFGTRLWTLAFDQNTAMLPDIARKTIVEDINIWIPGVTVVNVDVNPLKSDKTTDDRDIYRLHIAVQFLVNATKQTDTIEVNVDSRS